MSLNRQGRKTDRRRRPLRACALACALALAIASPASAVPEKNPKSIKIVGQATKVEPGAVSIRAEGGQEVTLQTHEDLTQKVAVGSKVTAWYFTKDGTNVLGSVEPPLENFFSPADQIRSGIKKVIILPDSAVPEGERILDAIANYAESNLGWYVAPRILAEEIRNRWGAPASTLDALDPESGEFDMARYLERHRELIRKLADETRVDAVLEANVERVQAPVYAKVAYWDGVEQPLTNKGSRMLSLMGREPGEGEVPAATVQLKLWNAQSKLLWSHRRGFTVLAVLIGGGNKFRDHPVSKALEKNETVDQWLTAVFGSLLPAPARNQAKAKE